MDWADVLAAKYQARNNNLHDADSLRKYVQHSCKDNLRRWKKERPENWDEDKEKTQETQRLIQLCFDTDSREQLEWDFKKNKKIIVHADHNQIGKISSVKLPLNPDEWSDLLNKSGKYLPACCANISRMRNLLQEALSEEGFMEVEDLWELAMLAKGHDFSEGKAHPVGRLVALWDQVAEFARERIVGKSVNIDNPKDALEALYQASSVICWNDMFGDESKERKFCNHVNNERALITVMTAVRTLFFKFRELSKGDIQGFGIIRQDGEIGESTSGLAIYSTQEIAQEICDRWNRDEQRKENRNRDPYSYSVKKVKISLTHGIEVING
jgi:hypothetical protein